MACINPNKPDCKHCNKAGLAILPVRYTVVPQNVPATLPEPLGNKVTDIKLQHHHYALRTLRQGFLYLYYEKHPHLVKWEVYSVAPDGSVWKQLAPKAAQPYKAPPPCALSKGHPPGFHAIAIEEPERQGKVWMAFSEHIWSSETLKAFETDDTLRDKRMQTFLPAVWVKTPAYRHGLAATQKNIEQILEYQDNFNIDLLTDVDPTVQPESNRIEPVKPVVTLSKSDGSYRQALLEQQSTRYPLYMRRGKSQEMADLLEKVGDMGKEKHPAAIIALWDAVGITHELNGFRNDAAGRIEQYGKERELQITAVNAIEGAKKVLENRAQSNVEDGMDMPFKWSPAKSQVRLKNTIGKGGGAEFEANERELCRLWEKDAIDRAPNLTASRRGFLTRHSTAEFHAEMKKIDAEIAQIKQARARPDVAKLRKNRVNEAIAQSWPKYQEKLNDTALKTFKDKHAAFLKAADTIIDNRTDDLLAWLESKPLRHALTEYHGQNPQDGVNFEDAVGDMVFGITSSPKGAKTISDWVGEAKATKTNLLWRAIASNQDEGIQDVNDALAVALAHTGTPFDEAALNTVRDSTKHIAKMADLGKKALGLHNTLRKDGVIRVATGGIEKIFMTVGDRFFQPFIKKGVDVVAEKFVQGLLLARSGCEYTKIMGLMLAEAQFGKIGRTETLLAMSIGHAIADKNASQGFKTLKDAWAKLASTADTPKTNANPKLAGGFNEARDMRFAMVSTVLQGLFAWKLAQDAEQDPNNKKLAAELLASRLSFGAGLIDLGATAIKGLSAAKDAALSYQFLKMAGGALSAGAAWIAYDLDWEASKKSEHYGAYNVAYLYKAKALSNLFGGACSALATLSYAEPAMQLIKTRFPKSLIARVAGNAFSRLFAWRAILMLGGLWINVAVIAIQFAIWYFSDNELQNWCNNSAFGKEKKEPFPDGERQMEAFKKALLEVM